MIYVNTGNPVMDSILQIVLDILAIVFLLGFSALVGAILLADLSRRLFGKDEE